MERETVVVTGAIIPDMGRLLVARRHPYSRFEPGKWEFPGGKLDFGEDPVDCVQREILEELGIGISVHALYDARSHVYSDERGERHVVLLFYLCSVMSGTPSCLDCAEIAHVTREELLTLPFVEGDRGILRRVISDDSIWSQDRKSLRNTLASPM